MSKFTRIPENTFKEIVINAGLLATNFNPNTAEVAESELMGATSGGVSFTATPSFIDYGEDIDNCPANTMELKRIAGWGGWVGGGWVGVWAGGGWILAAPLSGTLVTLNTALGKKLAAAADETAGKIVPRSALSEDDFADIWLIGDYSGENGNGYIAVHLINALNTGGLQITTQNKAKGQFAFDFSFQYSINTPEIVPYELYIMQEIGA